MNVFTLRDQLIAHYSDYVRSFIQIRNEQIRAHVEQRLEQGILLPEPLTQLNPSFEPGAWIDNFMDACALPRSAEVEFDAGLASGVVNSMAMPELEALPEMVTDDELEGLCKVG